MVSKALKVHKNTDCFNSIIRVPKVNGFITCIICEGQFKTRIEILEHLQQHPEEDLNINGFSLEMVRQQANDLV